MFLNIFLCANFPSVYLFFLMTFFLPMIKLDCLLISLLIFENKDWVLKFKSIKFKAIFSLCLEIKCQGGSYHLGSTVCHDQMPYMTLSRCTWNGKHYMNNWGNLKKTSLQVKKVTYTHCRKFRNTKQDKESKIYQDFYHMKTTTIILVYLSKFYIYMIWIQVGIMFYILLRPIF